VGACLFYWTANEVSGMPYGVSGEPRGTQLLQKDGPGVPSAVVKGTQAVTLEADRLVPAPTLSGYDTSLN
jgi:hypothetical protein